MRSSYADAAIAEGLGPIWLATIMLPDGRYIRVATEPCMVEPAWEGADGPYSYDPFLIEVSDFQEELDYFALEGSASLTQASIDIATTEDLAALQGDWYAVTAGTVELSLIWPGEAWEDRHVVLGGGRVQQVDFGLVGEATTVSVEAGPAPTSSNIGDDTRDVGVDFPPGGLDVLGVEMSGLEGSRYQWVYGDPESVPLYKVGEISAGLNRAVIAGHTFPDNGASYPVTTREYVDGLVVATGSYDVTNGGDYAFLDDATAFGSAKGAYTYSAVHGGIASAIDQAGPALGAAEVLRRLLVDSGLTVDWRKMQPALERLGSWRVGFYIDQETSAIDVVRDLIGFLPLVEVTSGDGLWFAYGNPHAAPIEAELTLGQELLGRTGRMSTTDLEMVRNSFTLSFWKDAATGEYLETVTLGPDESHLCYLSQQLYGERADEVLECGFIWDATTALQVLHHRASRYALPRRVLEYTAAPDCYWLEVGMVVLLTDADYSISGHRGVITALSRSTVDGDQNPYADGDFQKTTPIEPGDVAGAGPRRAGRSPLTTTPGHLAIGLRCSAPPCLRRGPRSGHRRRHGGAAVDSRFARRVGAGR